MRRTGSLLCLLALLAIAHPGGAAARPDGPLPAYVEHMQRLVLEWPADGTVTDVYGPRWGRMHLGVDVGILRALDVTAAAPGFVTAVGWLPGYEGYGTVVLVDVGDGYSTLYAHLARARVRAGDWVSAGSRLGLAGCTGSCTGTHLHFELRRAGEPVDPLPFLAATGYNRPPPGG